MKTIDYEFGIDEFEYELTCDDIQDIIGKFGSRFNAEYHDNQLNIEDIDDYESDILEAYEEEIKDLMQDNAHDAYMLAKDPYAYYGVSRNDFR